MRRRWCARMTHTNSTWNVAVGHGEEVGGHEVAGMVPQERTPGGRWRVALPDPVLGDRGRRDLDAELPQLAIDAGRPPEWIGPADLPDQRPDVWIDRGSS